MTLLCYLDCNPYELGSISHLEGLNRYSAHTCTFLGDVFQLLLLLVTYTWQKWRFVG